MRGDSERECLKEVKEFFFCYKERNFQMMLSNRYYQLRDDDMMFNIKDYINLRKESFVGMEFKDIKKVFIAIKNCKPNPNLSKFPDFVFKDGFIEHFEITSSKETRKGSAKKIDEFEFEKEINPHIKEFNQSCENMEIGERREGNWSRKDVCHSYDNLKESFCNNLKKHLSSSDNYQGKLDIKIYMIEYSDCGLEMIENVCDEAKEPEHLWVYRLSKDKNMLRFLYQYKNKIDYIIMNYKDFCETIKVDEIPNILRQIPYDYMIKGRVNMIIRKQINTRVGFNM
ncbi:MAG: hypothetical protein E7351_03195 [Clostridiales bacterium]|nr:hypothetical protein [Clostridiales bacterium]